MSSVEAATANSSVFLNVQGPGIARQVPVGDQPVSIGRHSQNILVLPDNLSSRFHCVIGRKDGGYFVRDLNSSNGTLLNGRRVTTSAMAPGDVVKIGSTRITLVGPGMPAKPAPANNVPHAAAHANGDDDLEPIELADLPPDLDALTDEDLAEPLSEEDVVLGDPSPDLVPISTEDDQSLMPAMVDQDPERVLRTLAESLPNKPFTERDIALANSRGQIVHAAGRKESDSESVTLFRLLMLTASRSRATDIHFEPKNGEYLVRMRVDGVMVDVVRLPTDMGIKLSALVKVLGEMDLAQRNSIQEGHFSSRVPTEGQGMGRRIDYRVSFAPSVFGQKLVLRVLDTSNAPLHIGALGLPQWMRKELEGAVRQDAGMVLVCGPTGSGKTTTLYALLRGCDVQRRNVVTIEDPVEIQMPSVTQIPVDESQDKTFSNLLRSVLRQDPDVILIGEIRDAETARIAMQAAITGHLVFSTIHTRDTVGTVFRLLDLNVEPYLVAQALHFVLAQRLARQLCPYCKVPTKPTAQQLDKMGPSGQNAQQIFVPRGCPRCLNTGFSGRRGFFELLVTSNELRDLIARTPTLTQIQEQLRGTQFQSLQHSGYDLVAQGVVAFEEIDRSIGKDQRF